MDYPNHIHIETLALCPAACSFCPYPTLERKGTRMSDALIDKIFSDLSDIPKHIPLQISPFKVNEPFMDKRMLSILKRINSELPQAQITLTTNTTPLTPKKLAELQAIENLQYIWVSLNDYRSEHYEKTMALSWARTQERLQMLHRAKDRGRLTTEVILSRVGDNSFNDQRFQEWVKETFPLFQSFVFPRGGWLGQVDAFAGTSALMDVPNVGCVRWFELSITASGTVAHCCMDGKAEWPIGDINTQHILDVYNHPTYRQLREKTLSRHDTSPCNTCTFL